jgi:hypothetical protein
MPHVIDSEDAPVCELYDIRITGFITHEELATLGLRETLKRGDPRLRLRRALWGCSLERGAQDAREEGSCKP